MYTLTIENVMITRETDWVSLFLTFHKDMKVKK